MTYLEYYLRKPQEIDFKSNIHVVQNQIIIPKNIIIVPLNRKANLFTNKKDLRLIYCDEYKKEDEMKFVHNKVIITNRNKIKRKFTFNWFCKEIIGLGVINRKAILNSIGLM